MAKYVIEGPNKIKGKVQIYGNKNEVLPVLAAALLSDKKVVVKNVPRIRDVMTMLELLSSLGTKYKWLDKSTLSLITPKIISDTPNKELVSKLRASILLVGPLLARIGQAKLSFPGGDIIGRRPITAHLEALSKIGVTVSWESGYYLFKRPKSYISGRVFLTEASVTATENFLLATALSPDSSFILLNAATEPHVRSLSNFLNKMGVNITNIGLNKLLIQGVVSPQPVEHTILPDHIEVGTFMLLAAATGSQLEIKEVIPQDLEPIINHLTPMGIHFNYQVKTSTIGDVWQDKPTNIIVSPKHLKALDKVETNIWPGFPTDLMSPLIVAATQAEGVTLCHDWMYEGRMFFVDKLVRMGAKIIIADPHRVVVFGPTALYAKELESPDIRAGMALVIAAIIARGTSVIHQVELIERGYADLVPRLEHLGVKIKRLGNE